jgi:tRNA(Ile)-lysidine synthase
MVGSRSSRCTDLARFVAAFLREHVETGDRISLGLSGGLDSSVLLHLLVRLRPEFGYSLQAEHVNHRISPHADEWADICAHICSAVDVPLSIHAVDVVDSGEGIEAAARRARYAVFAGLDADVLALAHQRDDQAETVLLNLLRGSGLVGAAAMPAERLLGKEQRPARLRVLRPLLGVFRDEVRSYAVLHGLRWIEDESNAETRLARNFLRLEAIPLLEQRFPGCRSSLARSADLAADAAELLDELARIDLGDTAERAGGLAVAALRSLTPSRATNLLRYWLRSRGAGVPTARRLWEILRQLTESRADAAVEIRVGEHLVRRFRGSALVMRDRLRVSGVECQWSGQAKLPWGESTIRFAPALGAGIRRDALDRGQVVIRRRRGGEKLRLTPSQPRRSLKQLFQEAGVPPWDRRDLPILWCGADVVWIPDVGIAAEYRCDVGAQGWTVCWERD